jgi:hypothetical protein
MFARKVGVFLFVLRSCFIPVDRQVPIHCVKTHTHWKRNPLSAAASPQALESVQRKTETSIDCSLIAKNFVESLAVQS